MCVLRDCAVRVCEDVLRVCGCGFGFKSIVGVVFVCLVVLMLWFSKFLEKKV